MKRLYYAGVELAYDDRLAGVRLTHGQAVDVPEELAEVLVSEGMFVEAMTALPSPLPKDVQDVPEGEIEITWYEPEPGEELLALHGVGPAMAAKMVEADVSTLSDLTLLTREEVWALADVLRGVDTETVSAWVDQANDLI